MPCTKDSSEVATREAMHPGSALQAPQCSQERCQEKTLHARKPYRWQVG